MNVSNRSNLCPCGTPRRYENCCGIYHAGTPAPDAVALMRSRYSAFVLELGDYLLATWSPETRPESMNFSEATRTQWIGLKVLRAEAQLGEAEVEFVARYKLNGKAHKLHETSRFEKRGERWYYVDGRFEPE
jgi:SEC-C motif domain protein